MTAALDDRLNQILPRIISEDFLAGKGLSNDNAFFIFDYPAEEELRVRTHIDFLLEHAPKQKPGLRIKHLNLLDFAVGVLEDRNLLYKTFAIQHRLQSGQQKRTGRIRIPSRRSHRHLVRRYRSESGSRPTLD